MLHYIKLERLLMRGHPELNEQWVEDRIAEDPTILHLGDVILKDRQRNQRGAGRLDLLLLDPESGRRFEVEIQLGRTDETHIIRTLEYWDIESKRFPRDEHYAVLVAEDITSRFLNVISLFHGAIPLIAIQMQAVRLDDKVSLLFTTVLDAGQAGNEEEDDTPEVGRSYWESRTTTTTVEMVDQLFEVVRGFADGLELKYNRQYIKFARNGRPYNFVVMWPQKRGLILGIKLEQSEDITGRIETIGFDEVMPYDIRYGNYRVRLTSDELKKHATALQDLMKLAYENLNS